MVEISTITLGLMMAEKFHPEPAEPLLKKIRRKKRGKSI
jgi:hypothetical protein